MEELELISRNQISDDILKKLAMTSSTLRSTHGELFETKPRISNSTTPRPIAEISALISRRKNVYDTTGVYEDVFKRQFSIRPLDEMKRERYRLKGSQKERPMSEIAVPNEWKRKTWDVSAIDQKPFPPVHDKPDLRRPTPSYAKFEAYDDDVPMKSKRSSNEQTTNERQLDTSADFKSKTDTLSVSMDSNVSMTSERNKQTRKTRKSDKSRSRSKQSTTQNVTPPLRIGDGSISEVAHLMRTSCLVAPLELCAPGWGSRTLDKRFLEQAAREIILDLDVVC